MERDKCPNCLGFHLVCPTCYGLLIHRKITIGKAHEFTESILFCNKCHPSLRDEIVQEGSTAPNGNLMHHIKSQLVLYKLVNIHSNTLEESKDTSVKCPQCSKNDSPKKPKKEEKKEE